AVSPAPVLSSAAGSSASVSPSPSARRLPPLRELRTEHGGDIERLGFQLQEFFGTDISVAHLADSLSVRTWQITVAGPENRVRQVQIANTNSATAILDRVRRAFGLDSDIDGDQYSLFSMTSEGGGARCLSNEELARMFADPDSTPPEKFFLRKRHQLSRPPIGLKRYEHLQRAIERLGNIIPSTPPPPPPLLASTVSLPQQLLQRPSTKWESTTEKLTKILGERPPSELVSLNVEKYFPGNEARARHSIMRRRKNESQEAAAAAAAAATGTGPDGHDSVGRSSRRQSRANRRASRTSVRTMQSRIRSLTLGSDERLSGFSNNLEPIKESLQSPALPAAAVPAPPLAPPQAAPAAPPASARVPASGAPALPAASWGARTRQPQAANSAGATPQIAEATVPAAPAVDASASDSGDGLPSKARVTSLPLASPSGSCASLQYSDDDDLRSGSDDDNNMGTLSDLSDSDLSDSFDDSSFCKSLGDSDIDGDEDLATYDSALRTGDDSADGAAGAGAGAGASAAEDSAAAGAAAKGADADERRLSTA
ncbi:ATP binding, partial [Coemansia nantahalensis]